jgi:hypothetical protein
MYHLPHRPAQESADRARKLVDAGGEPAVTPAAWSTRQNPIIMRIASYDTRACSNEQ